MLGKPKSDGLGGFLGVSQTLKLGTDNRFGNRIFLSSLLSVFKIIFYCLQLYNAMGFSLIISLQHNNEIYKHIKLSHLSFKIIPMSTRNVTFTRVCITVLFTTNTFLLLLDLLILSGDIHPNPGPASVGSLNVSSLSSTASMEMLSKHLNIQSLLPKIDLIRSESDAYDIMVFSESWLKPDLSDNDIQLKSFFPPVRSDWEETL